MSYPAGIAFSSVTRPVCRSLTMRYDLSVVVLPCHTRRVAVASRDMVGVPHVCHVICRSYHMRC